MSVQGETQHPWNMSGQEVSSAQVRAQFISLSELQSGVPNFSSYSDQLFRTQHEPKEEKARESFPG